MMFVVALLAIGVGVVAGAIVESGALAKAHAAHRVADAHAQAAQVAIAEADVIRSNLAGPQPSGMARFRDAWHRAVAHANAADAANRVAITQTADAAQTATTDAARAAVAASAQAVIARDATIQTARAKLGVGQCGVRSYPHVTARVRDALLARLRAEHMTVTGGNPYKIETHEPGLPLVDDVVLTALWDGGGEVLHLVVASGRGALVTCDEIWKRIEPKLRETLASAS